MVRDDDAWVVRLDGAARDANGATDGGEEEPCRAPRQRTAPVDAGQHGENDAQRNHDGEQGQPGIEAVGEMEDASHCRSRVVRVCVVRLTFMSKLPSPQCDIRNGFATVFCDTCLFMLTLPNFCEGGHAGGRTPNAYSIRCDMLLGMSRLAYKALNHIRKLWNIRSHSGNGAQLLAQQPGSGRHEST